MSRPRSSRNSRESLPAPPTSSATSSTITSGAAVAASPASCSVPVNSPSPEFVASLVQAMQAPIASMVNSALSSAGIATPTVTNATSSTTATSQLAAPSSQSSLSHQANYLGQQGSALPWISNAGNVALPLSQPPSLSQGASLTSVAQGRSEPINVPSFVSTRTNPSSGLPVSVNNPVGISAALNNYTTNRHLFLFGTPLVKVHLFPPTYLSYSNPLSLALVILRFLIKWFHK